MAGIAIGKPEWPADKPATALENRPRNAARKKGKAAWSPHPHRRTKHASEVRTMSREAWGDPPDIDRRAEAEAAQEARLEDHAYAEGRKDEREATLAEFAALLPGPYYMDPPDGGSVTVLEQFRRMALDAQRLRAENAALKREAHIWWTAARDAAMDERARCALRVALHSQYPITTDFDRGYDKARKDAAEMLRTMGDDAGLELGPNAKVKARP